MDEYFTLLGGLTRSLDGKTLTKGQGFSAWNDTSYGTISIPSTSKCICEWSIRINKGNNIRLGVSIGPKIPNYCCFTSHYENNYGYSIRNGFKIRSGRNVDKRKYASPCQQGDVIKIRLDLINFEISFYKNNINQGIAFTKIKHGGNINYFLAVSMRKANWSLTLQDFKKYEEIDEDEKETKAAIQRENDRLRKRIEYLQNDQKEKELIIQEMNIEIENLRIKLLDLSNFRLWKWDDVFIWIMSLENGRYKKYQNRLKKNLRLQDIGGQDLESIVSSDIIDLGVTKFNDKKALLKCIQTLIKQNNECQYNLTIEGAQEKEDEEEGDGSSANY